MAIDSAAKRFSMMGFQNPVQTLIPPDGTIDQGDRQTFLHLYSGILAAGITLTIGGLAYNWQWEYYED